MTPTKEEFVRRIRREQAERNERADRLYRLYRSEKSTFSAAYCQGRRAAWRV